MQFELRAKLMGVVGYNVHHYEEGFKFVNDDWKKLSVFETQYAINSGNIETSISKSKEIWSAINAS